MAKDVFWDFLLIYYFRLFGSYLELSVDIVKLYACKRSTCSSIRSLSSYVAHCEGKWYYEMTNFQAAAAEGVSLLFQDSQESWSGVFVFECFFVFSNGKCLFTST